MNAIQGMLKVNFRQSQISYLLTGILVATAVATSILAMAGVPTGTMPIGNYLYFLPLFMAIFIPAKNFSRLMHLGGKRIDFFKASLRGYILVIAAVTLVSILLYYAEAALLAGAFTGPNLVGVYMGPNLLDVFGFIARGPVVAFFQMFAFFFMYISIVHTLTISQNYTYGWIVDVTVGAVICVFTSITPLRAALGWFFNLTIFHDIAIVQILISLILGAGVYTASLISIRNKMI
jgi:hypothetical protein